MRGTDSLGSVLRPVVSSWKRHRPWAMEDLPDPEPLAREAVAELQGALEGLFAVRKLLGGYPPCPGPARSMHEVQGEARRLSGKCASVGSPTTRARRAADS